MLAKTMARTALISVLVCILLLSGGCASDGLYTAGWRPSRVLARDAEFVVVQVGHDDARTLAKRFLGEAERYWVIEDANAPRPVAPGEQIIIPLKQRNTSGIDYHGYQTVPILCYHRFGDHGDRLEVSEAQFREQLNYLKAHDYRVIRMADLLGFLRGEHALPKRAVVLTMDDGHRSIYKIAYPLLKEFGFPATLFVYSDYLDNGGLRWRQLEEMVDSGLITVQPHSKTHDNLTLRRRGESDARYRRRLRNEVNGPTMLLRRRLKHKVEFYAYPYGDANSQVVEELRVNGLKLGLTVQPHGNPAFAHPYLLRRTMIFGHRDMEAFKAALEVYTPRDAS
ncbi:MAG: polysaccharide deacetylase family protein [Chromatiales bacterium]|jgi:peptidoglycan/xylan/chitin deacetylase (PgdA/CDA1 family)